MDDVTWWYSKHTTKSTALSVILLATSKCTKNYKQFLFLSKSLIKYIELDRNFEYNRFENYSIVNIFF